jgi:hypothetical protein
MKPPSLSIQALLVGFALAGSPSVLAQGEVDRSSLEEAFAARYGPGWTFEWDDPKGTPSSVYGPGAPVASPGPWSEAEAASIAASLLEANRDLLGVGPSQLVPIVLARGGRVQYFVYRQTFEGLEVLDTRVDLRLHVPTGRLLRIGSRVLRDLALDPTPRLDEATAVSLAARFTGFVAGRDAFDGARLVVLPVGREGRLAWEVGLRVADPLTHPLVFLDARTGALLETRERIHFDYSGNVSGFGTSGLLPDLPSNPPVAHPIPGVTVNIPGIGSAVTDGSGNFTIPSGSGAAQSVTVNLSGPHFNVNNFNGTGTPQTDSTVTMSIPAGGSANFLFNATPAQFPTGEVNGARFTKIIRDYVQGIVSVPGIDTPIPVNVNRDQTCNAFFSSGGGGPNINFFFQGGNCVNTAYSTVVYHEYGHFVDFALGGIVGTFGISEGWGDVLAVFLTGQPIIGANFTLSGGFIRTADNSRKYPAMECFSEVHCLGEIWAGFCWHLRQNLIASLGAGPGVLHAEDIVIPALLADESTIQANILEVMMLDDDDGNLANGTPNLTAIAKAAQQHGFLADTFAALTFAHVPAPDTTQTTGSYPVSVTAVPIVGSISSVSLSYSLNDGVGFSTVPLSPAGGNLWTGSIPAQPAPETVFYFFTATNDQAYSRRFPFATGDVFALNVGQRTTIFADDMESGPGGWTHVQLQTQDDWQHGAPNTSNTNEYDPTSAHSGTNVWGNDLAPAGFNGSYQNNVINELRSVTLNLSGKTGTRLRYRRWATIRPNDFGRIRVNGSDVFSTSASAGQGDTTWNLHDFPIGSIADNNPSVQLTWRLESNSSTSQTSVAGGWTIDDVEVYTVEPLPPCPAVVVLGPGTAGSGGLVPTLTTNGPAQIGSAGFALVVGSGLGGAVAVLSDGLVETSVPFAGGTIYIVPLLTFTATLSGPGGVAGAGTVSFPHPIPAEPALVGGVVSAQAAVLDPAATAGIALTQGIRITVCL